MVRILNDLKHPEIFLNDIVLMVLFTCFSERMKLKHVENLPKTP